LSGAGRHAGPEAVLALAASDVRLIGALHEWESPFREKETAPDSEAVGQYRQAATVWLSTADAGSGRERNPATRAGPVRCDSLLSPWFSTGVDGEKKSLFAGIFPTKTGIERRSQRCYARPPVSQRTP
jgi:hypothetical protein